ncbi:MAG: hypothetical protein KC646_03090 [Candidatus Cloacimonetes bacterium]|nr:hypothetical protein [Candidatus Cloacimonadota bacterium]
MKLLVYCIVFGVYLVSITHSQSRNTPLSSRLDKYRSYLKPGHIKAKPRVHLKQRSSSQKSRNYIDPLCEQYLSVLHVNYKTSVKLFKQYLEFLKNKNSRQLNTFKVRTHQLKNFIQRVLDSAIVVKASINRSKSTLTLHLDEHKTLALELLDTQPYSKVHHELQMLKFYQNSYLSFLSEINQREILHLESVLYNINEWLELVITTEKNNWQKSPQNLVLKDSDNLINKIQKEVPRIAKKFQNIKDHFSYAEQEIIADKAKIRRKTFPYSKSLNQELESKLKRRNRDFSKSLFSLNEKESIELELIQRQIISSQKLSPIELRLNPLSHHLFFNNSIEKQIDEPLPDWL